LSFAKTESAREHVEDGAGARNGPLDPVLALARWAELHRPAIQGARDRFDAKGAGR
jgi:hypothetical protein